MVSFFAIFLRSPYAIAMQSAFRQFSYHSGVRLPIGQAQGWEEQWIQWLTASFLGDGFAMLDEEWGYARSKSFRAVQKIPFRDVAHESEYRL